MRPRIRDSQGWERVRGMRDPSSSLGGPRDLDDASPCPIPNAGTARRDRIGVQSMLAGVTVALALAALAGWRIAATLPDNVDWDHWDVVKPGLLYRSGQLDPDQLEEAVRRYGLKTVINLQLPSPTLARERQVARRLGLNYAVLPMPGDGLGRPDQFRRVLDMIDDPKSQPVLVHCARGTCRTGSAVALMRYERDGWTLEDVEAELKRHGYRQRAIAGYVYNMVSRTPFYELNGDEALDPFVGSPQTVEDASTDETISRGRIGDER